MALLIWMLLGIVWVLQVIKLARPIRPEDLSERARRRLGYDDAEAVDGAPHPDPQGEGTTSSWAADEHHQSTVRLIVPGNKPVIRRGAGRTARVRTISPPQGSRRPAA